MKSYTDLEQSKELAKILSLESADMWYDNNGESIAGIPEIRCGTFTGFASKFIPCWSLAVLLGVIPEEVEIKGQRYAPCLFPISNGYWLYRLWYNSNEIIESPISVYCDNLIDACYEMIIKLKENNLI